MDEGFPVEAETLLPEGALPLDEQDRVLAMIRQKTEAALPKKEEEKTVKKTRFGLMLLAAALVLGTVAASAAFQADGRIARMLGVESESWQEFLDGSGAAIQASQESNGWTLTLNQAVGDQNCAYIMVDLTAPEGTVLDAQWYRLECKLDFDHGWSGGYGCSMMEDEDKTDNKVSFLLDVERDQDLRGAKGRLTATEVVEFFSDDDFRVHDGMDWELDFTLRYKNDPIVYRPGQTVEVEGGTITVVKVEITALSARVKLTSKDGGLGRWEVGDIQKPLPVVTEMRMLDEEGNPIPVDSWGSHDSGRDGINTATEHTMVFRPIIDPDRVTALSIGGVVIPLK